MRTIAHISDLHFGRADPAIAQGLAADLAQLPPDLLIVSGDLTQRGRRRQYAAAAGYLARLPRPQIVIPGNHDIPLFDLMQRFLFPLQRYRRFIGDDLAPFYQDEEIAVLGINTARSWAWRCNGFWKDGRISAADLRAAQSRFAALPPNLLKILVTHHPFIPPSPRHAGDIVGGARPALRILESCGVELLLAGHLHTGYSGDVRAHHQAVARSILSIQAGTAISTRRRREPNTYNLIRVQADHVAIHIRAWTGLGFEEIALTRYVRDQGAWKPAT